MPYRRPAALGQESSGVTTPLVGRLIDTTSPDAAFTILGLLGILLSFGIFFNRRWLAAPRVEA